MHKQTCFLLKRYDQMQLLHTLTLSTAKACLGDASCLKPHGAFWSSWPLFPGPYYLDVNCMQLQLQDWMLDVEMYGVGIVVAASISRCAGC